MADVSLDALPFGAGTGTAAPAINAAPGHACTVVAFADAPRVASAWDDLARRAIEPNVFFERPALVPLAEAFGRSPELLCAWRGAPGTGDLVGLVPIDRRRTGFGVLGRLPSIASGKYGTVGVPLIDRRDPAAVWRALLAALAGRGTTVLVAPYTRGSGAVHEALAEALAERGGGIELIEPALRAVIAADRPPDAYFREEVARKRRKEWRRLWRRFQEAGAATHETIVGAAVPAAFEEFLALEASGWKGRSGTALGGLAADGRFARQMVAALATDGRCEIDRIGLDGKPVAMLVTLKSGGSVFIWKIAYDEAFAAFSPGMQVVLRATERFLEDPAVDFGDSLAIANHPLIDHLWRERLPMGTAIIRIGRSGGTRAALAAADLRAHLAARRFAKRAVATVKAKLKPKTTLKKAQAS